MHRKRQAIRDHSAEANLFARRATIAFIIVIAMLGIVLNNLYSLQVTQFEDYQTRSNGNRIKVLPIAPNRGLIYDRNGVLLAENRPVFSLEVIPEQVDDIDATLLELTELMGITNDELERFQSTLKGTRRFKPVALRTQLSEEEVALFSASKHKFPGVQIEARLARHYLYKETLTHALGYVARINKRDLQKLVEAVKKITMRLRMTLVSWVLKNIMKNSCTERLVTNRWKSIIKAELFAFLVLNRQPQAKTSYLI